MEYCWNLSELYSDFSCLDKDILLMKNYGEKLVTYRGKLSSEDSFYNYLIDSENFNKLQDKIGSYLYFCKSLDGSNSAVIEKIDALSNYLSSLTKKLAFVSAELKKIDNSTLSAWANDKKFSNYNNYILDIIKNKKHTLNPKTEKLMIGATESHYQSEIFDSLNNVELTFGKTVDENGKMIELNNGNYALLSVSSNKKVRKSAIKKCLLAFGKVNQTLSFNYISHLKSESFVAHTYKYKSTLDMQLDSSYLPSGLPQNVVKNVTKFLPLVYRYYAWRKKFMNLDKFESCDVACNLENANPSQKYTLKQGSDIIVKALGVLGSDYTSKINEAFKNNWIDSGYKPNKETGGYMADVYGVHPFILLTFDGTSSAVSTLAHELGHAMHSYYSNLCQPYPKHDHDIFVAEVASTVNEIILNKYFIEHAKNKQEKISYICKFLDNFIATIFRQTQYTEFELFVHQKIEDNEPLSYKTLNDYYFMLQKKYMGDGVIVMPETKYHWSRVPHFYRDFYVFKYATGMVSACAIVTKLFSQKSYNQKYRKFLSSGSSLKPIETLKLADVDILSEQTYNQAMEIFENYLQMLETL